MKRSLEEFLVKACRQLARGQWPLAVAMSLALPCYSVAQQGSLVLPSTTITSGTPLFQAPNSITNSSTFSISGSASVLFSAGQSITLQPGFTAVVGSAAVTFHAVINTSDQSGPIIDGGQLPPPSSPTKEYIYLGRSIIAIENPQ